MLIQVGRKQRFKVPSQLILSCYLFYALMGPRSAPFEFIGTALTVEDPALSS